MPDVTGKPDNDQTWAEVKYVILFLVEKEETMQFVRILESVIDYYFKFMIILIAIFLEILFLVIGAIVVIFTRRITKPIQILTVYTDKLQIAEDKEKKE